MIYLFFNEGFLLIKGFLKYIKNEFKGLFLIFQDEH